MTNSFTATRPITLSEAWRAFFRELSGKLLNHGRDPDLPRVLVSYVYTDYKAYVKDLPRTVFKRLTYPNKTYFMVSSVTYPEIERFPSGEQKVAYGRQLAIEHAREEGYDYILFLDADVVPPRAIIELLLACNEVVVGAAVAARGQENLFVAHNYIDREAGVRESITQDQANGVIPVDGVGVGCSLFSREAFMATDYLGYVGPGTTPGRYTGSDEFIFNKLFANTGMRPAALCSVTPWHLHEDGWAYRLWGKKLYWIVFREYVHELQKHF